MSGRSFLIALVFLLLVSVPASSQTVSQAVATKDPTAVKLLSASVSALANGTSINDVTLTGTVTRTAGSDVETGSVTLSALGGTAGRIDFVLSGGNRSEIVNQTQGAPAGRWSEPDGTTHPMAPHNCWIPAGWFVPALALAEALNDPSVMVTYIGQETQDGLVVQHVRFTRLLAAQSGSATAPAAMESLNVADVYLDASNGRPVELDFNIHPDDNAAVNLAVEVQYSNYQQLNGILVPEHIEKLINNSLFLDMHITSANLNANLSPSDFAVAAQ